MREHNTVIRMKAPDCGWCPLRRGRKVTVELEEKATGGLPCVAPSATVVEDE